MAKTSNGFEVSEVDESTVVFTKQISNFEFIRATWDSESETGWWTHQQNIGGKFKPHWMIKGSGNSIPRKAFASLVGCELGDLPFTHFKHGRTA